MGKNTFSTHLNEYLTEYTHTEDISIAILNVLKCTKELNFSGDCDEGVLCNNDVSVGPAENGDCLAHLPHALGTLPLQGAGPLQLGGGMLVVDYVDMKAMLV